MNETFICGLWINDLLLSKNKNKDYYYIRGDKKVYQTIFARLNNNVPVKFD